MRTRPLHEKFGVEVLDIDISSPRPGEIDTLREALDTHQLLVFRGGARLDPDYQVEIASWFGPPVDDQRDGKFWMLLHNDKDEGRKRLPFHSDFTYTNVPVKRIVLHALELPPSGTTTSFASGINGWATLPSALQKRLAPMTICHRHIASGPDAGLEFLTNHPVRFEHPLTQQPILFVTEYHAHRIQEVSQAESDQLIAEAKAHLYAPASVYEHRWERHDLLIWDNLAVQHARKVEAIPAKGTRIMQRVAVNQVPYADLVDRARVEASRR